VRRARVFHASVRQAAGVFSILPADQAGGSEGGKGGFQAGSRIMRTVRVVTSVQYYLKK